MKISMPTKAIGSAFTCDSDGRVLNLIRDDIPIGADLAPGRGFETIVHSASKVKAGNFLAELRGKGAAFDWEINILRHGEVFGCYFAGSRAGKDYVIIAAPSRAAVEAFSEQLMEMNNDHVNQLRALLKDHSRLLSQKTDPFDQLTALNSELSNLQRDLHKKNAELGRLNKLKDQFLGMAAHDLRNPIAGISGLAEIMLEEKAGLSPEYVKFIETIRGSADFMLRLVNDLLDISAIESGDIRIDKGSTSLGTLIERNAATNMFTAKKKNSNIVLQMSEGLPEIEIDRNKIEQVLNNLTSNALKFSPPGSTVIVRAFRNGDGIRVEVKDSGQGIPLKELSLLFKAFQKTSVRPTSGEKSTGLGLMIAKRIVEGHGGHIGVESEAGTGSTFWFTLPTQKQTSTEHERS